MLEDSLADIEVLDRAVEIMERRERELLDCARSGECPCRPHGDGGARQGAVQLRAVIRTLRDHDSAALHDQPPTAGEPRKRGSA